MHRFSLQHLSDAAVREGMKGCRARERSATAILIAHIAEAEARKLYLDDACDSMATYCMRELHLGEDEAYRRIHAGRAARRFPQIFGMLEDGRLNLTAVNVLAPRLTEANVDELLTVAACKSKNQILELLATRFPQSEPLPLVVADTSDATDRLALARVPGDDSPAALAPARVASPRSSVAPHAAGRYTATIAMDQAAHDDLRACTDLLGHVLPSGSAAEVIAFALRHLVTHLRKRRFGASDRPAGPRSTNDPRHIPARVRRAVYERDGGRCTFTGVDEARCGSRVRIELDHIVPVARGGESTVDNVRTLCRAHNQHAAEQVFGDVFMDAKRERAKAAQQARVQGDVLAALAKLGYRRAQAQFAAAACADMRGDATLEQRVRHALQQLLPPHQRISFTQSGAPCAT